jgi:hypothetical protein
MDAVKKGENLTTTIIENRFFGFPVSGKKGSVAKCYIILYRAVILYENYRLLLKTANRSLMCAVGIWATLMP